MTLKKKILSIVIFAAVMMSVGIGASQYINMTSFKNKMIEKTGQEVVDNTKDFIKSNVKLAIAVAKRIYDESKKSGLDKKTIEKKIISTLSTIRYGKNSNGYFFAYKQDGRGNTYFAFHGVKPHLNGRKTDINKPDIKGNRFRAKLIESAKKGGGFAKYYYKKPSSGKIIPKIAYAEMLPELGWVIVTGAYLDDVEKKSSEISKNIEEQKQTS